MGARRRLCRAIVLTVCAVAAAPIANAAAAPLLAIESPLFGSTTRNPAPVISGTSNDPSDGVSVVIFPGETASGTPVATIGPVAVSESGSWSATPSGPLAQGVYTARATQTASDETGEATTTFTIDTTPPAVSLTPVPTPSANSRPTFSGGAGTDAGDLPAITVNIYAGAVAAGSPLEALRVSATGATWHTGPAPPLPEGVYTAVAEQSDSAGNLGVSNAVTYAIAVRPVPPSASLLWIPASPLAGEPVSLVSTSLGGSSPIVSFAWDPTGAGPFVSGGAVFTTDFATAGAHAVRLMVTDSRGATAVAHATIHVGAPPLRVLLPAPVIRIAGTPFGHFVRIRLLSVEAPPGATVTVVCRGRSCPRASTARRQAAASANSAQTGLSPLTFRRFERRLRAGVLLQIVVSRAGYMGKYTSFLIRGNAPPVRHDACKKPGVARPVACPVS
jgi:hypothetical protein